MLAELNSDLEMQYQPGMDASFELPFMAFTCNLTRVEPELLQNYHKQFDIHTYIYIYILKLTSTFSLGSQLEDAL